MENTNDSIEVKACPAPDCYPWRVWRVERYFYAAQSLDAAKTYHMDEWGMEEDDLGGWDETPHDTSGYYEDATCHEEIWDTDPDCTMKGQAEKMIAGGASVPFMVAIELG